MSSPSEVEICFVTSKIANVFDKYDPPSVTYGERLKRINKVAVHPS